jgi:hypothetical protein
MSDVFGYSIPLGPNGRAFSFTLPADFNEQDANALIVMLPTLLSNAAVKETHIDVAIPNDFMYHRPTFGGDPLHVAANCKCSMLPVDEDMSSKPENIDISNEQVRDEGISKNGHADDNKLPNVDALLSDNGANDNKHEPISENAIVDAIDTALESVDEKPIRVPANVEPLPVGRWSRDYDACIDCGRTDRTHMAKGRCKRCDASFRKRLNRAKTKPVAVPANSTPLPQSRPSTDYEDQRRRIEEQSAGKSKAPAATVAKTAPVREPETVATPNGKPAWPLKGVSRDQAVEIVRLIAPKLKTQMTLDEMAVNIGENVDDVRKVYDTFKTDIDRANGYGANSNTAEIFKQTIDRRYGA